MSRQTTLTDSRANLDESNAASKDVYHLEIDATAGHSNGFQPEEKIKIYQVDAPLREKKNRHLS